MGLPTIALDDKYTRHISCASRVSMSAGCSVEDDLAAGIDLFPGTDPHFGLDEVEVEAEVYERSL
jgi:hypothetical protein